MSSTPAPLRLDLARRYASGRLGRLGIPICLAGVGVYYAVAQPVAYVPIEAAGALLGLLSIAMAGLAEDAHRLAVDLLAVTGADAAPPPPPDSAGAGPPVRS